MIIKNDNVPQTRRSEHPCPVGFFLFSALACESSVCARSNGSRFLNSALPGLPHNTLKQTDAQKKKLIVFYCHFSLLKQSSFPRPRVRKPRENYFCGIRKREKAKSLFLERKALLIPPPLASPTSSVGAGFSRSKSQNNLGSVTLS